MGVYARPLGFGGPETLWSACSAEALRKPWSRKDLATTPHGTRALTRNLDGLSGDYGARKKALATAGEGCRTVRLALR